MDRSYKCECWEDDGRLPGANELDGREAASERRDVDRGRAGDADAAPWQASGFGAAVGHFAVLVAASRVRHRQGGG